LKVNLDPNKKQHHNVGIPDCKTGYGIIFNGERWDNEKVSSIIRELLESKRKDLMEIKKELHEYLLDESKDKVEKTIENIQRIVEPLNEMDFKSQKDVSGYVKKHLINHYHLAAEAKKQTEPLLHKKPAEKTTEIQKIKLKEGMTFERIAELLNARKAEQPRLQLNKKMATILLQKIFQENLDENEYKLINDKIEKTEILQELIAIIGVLTLSLIEKSQVTIQIIDKKIEQNNLIMSFDC